MADCFQWTNKQGYTLMLTQEERDELLQLLKRTWGRPFKPAESIHFKVENDDYEEGR